MASAGGGRKVDQVHGTQRSPSVVRAASPELPDGGVASWEQSDEVDAFLYAVSHDLRTPAVAILGFVDVLRGELEDPTPEVALYLDRIAANALQLHHQLDDLLELSRVGRQHVDRQPVALDLLAHRVAALMAERWPQLSIEVGDLPTVRMNALRAEQLLSAIIDNAGRHNPERTTVLRVSAEPAPDGGLLVAFADDGVGLPEQFHAQALAVFGRVGIAGTAKGRSTGIGLTFASRIAGEIGGDVSLRCPDDGAPGLEVIVHLPADALVATEPMESAS